jgi:hypothetical protein
MINERGKYLLLFIFIIGFLFSSLHLQASTESSKLFIEFLKNDTITLKAKGVALGTLVNEFQKQAGLQFLMHESYLEHPIFNDFQSLPLKEAIKRILHEFNYAFIHDSNGNIEKIILLTFINKSKQNRGDRSIPVMEVSDRTIMKFAPPPENVNLREAMIIMPPSEDIDPEEAAAIKPPPKNVNPKEVLRIAPPPEDLKMELEAIFTPSVE